MKAFVTGATGFVGSHVARELAAQGAELRLLVREKSNLKNIESLRADRMAGNLSDPDSLRKGMSGCDAVFHVAADYRLWTRDSDEMYSTNVGGTRAVLYAARQAGVRRVVYCSSVATMAFNDRGVPATEADTVTMADMIGHYKRSKFVAERAAVQAAHDGLDVVIVNPTTPVGGQDVRPTPTGRIIVDFLKRKFPAYVDTGLNLVDVRDVALGHVLAHEKGRTGERYILGGENLTLKQILDKLAAITRLPSPTKKVPHSLAYVFALFNELISGYALGKEPRATREAVKMGRKKMFASSSKAERELGYSASPVDAALRRAVEWFQTHGYA